MVKLILPGQMNGPLDEAKVPIELRGDTSGRILMVFPRPVRSVVLDPNNAAILAKNLARAAVDQAGLMNAPDPLKDIEKGG